jgi:DNA-binding Xre family transcriptional regulator
MRSRLKQILDERKIKPYRFQRDIGIAQATAYSLYNNPDHLPSTEILVKICDRYLVSPGEVLEWIPPTKPHPA